MIFVIDNYDSFTYNLVHLVGAFTRDIEVARNDVMTADQVLDRAPSGIIISPGPGRPADAGITKETILLAASARIPLLGVCLGHQAIGEVFGGIVTYAPTLMHGKTSAIHHDGRSVFRNIENGFVATRYHSLVLDKTSLPDILEITAETPDGVIMGVRHRSLPIEGIQFHPESVLTETGPALISNWLETTGLRQNPATPSSTHPIHST